MKAYSKNPMKDMPQMGGMCGMPEVIGMQGMCPMMSMQGMYPMTSMQGMYTMMDMQDKCPMMCMQGMCPMVRMQSMNPMMGMQPPIPMISNLMQISPSQIQISYDRDVDMKLGVKATNYWIQDTMNDIPQGIATLGKNDKVNSVNSLTDSMIRIESKNGSAKTFILTFNQDIPSGAEYRLIICYVTVKGAPPYSGDNGMITFIGR